MKKKQDDDAPFDPVNLQTGPTHQEHIGLALHVMALKVCDDISGRMWLIVEHNVWAKRADGERAFSHGRARLRASSARGAFGCFALYIRVLLAAGARVRTA